VTTDNYNELQLIYLFSRYLSRRFIESARWKHTDSDEEEEKCKNSARYAVLHCMPPSDQFVKPFAPNQTQHRGAGAEDEAGANQSIIDDSSALQFGYCCLPTTRTTKVPSVTVRFGFCAGSAAGVMTTVAAGRKIFPVLLSKAIVFALGCV